MISTGVARTNRYLTVSRKIPGFGAEIETETITSDTPS
jgi:hypothetical protein